MAGIEFLKRLSALVSKEGTVGASAGTVQKLIEGLPADFRESIDGAGDDAAAVKRIRDHAQKLLDELDQTLAVGRDLLKAYADMPADPVSGAKPSLEDWLNDKQQSADDAEKPKIDRFLSFLDAPGSESIREEILSTAGAANLEAAIANAKSEIEAGLGQLETIAEALEKERQTAAAEPPPAAAEPPPAAAEPPPAAAEPPPAAAEPPPAVDKTLTNFQEFLANQEGINDPHAETIRQLLDRPTIRAEVGAGKIELAVIMKAIDQGTKSLPRWKRKRLKAAAKRLFDAHDPTQLQGAADSTDDRPTHDLSNQQKWTVSVTIAVAGLIILYGLIWPGELELFADNKIARGFITLLFSVGAISIFLVITAAIVFDIESESKEIYERSKTILSMLLGIFGTVLGFYFGLTENDQGEEFAVRQIEFIKAELGELDFKTSVAGGTAPYQFFIHVADEAGAPLENLVGFERSSSGTLTLAKPFDVSKHTGATLIVFVNAMDSKARTALSISEPHKVPPPTKEQRGSTQ